jgi:hypothetical protein
MGIVLLSSGLGGPVACLREIALDVPIEQNDASAKVRSLEQAALHFKPKKKEPKR